jgi:hypothetical protein
VASNSLFPIEEGPDDGPQVLSQSSHLGCSLIGLLIFGAFWNGIVAVFDYVLIFGDEDSIFLKLFLIPFNLIGLGLIGSFVYNLMRLFNPAPKIICSHQYVYAGREFEISWLFEKSAASVRHFSIILAGFEEVRYRQGTDTRTEKKSFLEIPIVDTDSPESIASGFEVVQMPIDAMHTFTASNNKILWEIRVVGDIRWWPNLNRNFGLRVYPPIPSN